MFEVMPGGRVIGTIFFLCLTFAAFSSAALMATCFSNALIDIGFTRKKAVISVVIGLSLFGIPSVLNQDYLTNQDNTWGYGLVFGTAFLGFLAHKYGEKKMRTQLIDPVSDIKASKTFDFLAGKLAPIVIMIVIIAWCVQAVGWNDQWWDPFAVSGLGTMVYQWAIVFILSIGLNKKINQNIKHKYFNGEEFGDIPDEILNEE